jgi:hypothetical protein
VPKVGEVVEEVGPLLVQTVEEIRKEPYPMAAGMEVSASPQETPCNHWCRYVNRRTHTKVMGCLLSNLYMYFFQTIFILLSVGDCGHYGSKAVRGSVHFVD